jgi:hypothetical protein
MTDAEEVAQAARALYTRAKRTVEQFGGNISIYEAAKFSACHGELRALLDACAPPLVETLRDDP